MSSQQDGAILEVRSLDTGYFGTPVVRGLNLHLCPGEVVALLGPNGAGKTTTLSTVAGIRRPLEGSIQYSGQEIARMASHRVARLGLSLVPEGRALFYGLTVREHLRLARRAGRREAAYDLLELLPELEKCMDRKAGLLSGGEQQMLALGRALVSQPRVLLVDEMSLGLAPVIVERLMPVVQRVARDTGAAVLCVEQHVELALEIADRAYVLSRGRIVLEGAARDLRQKPDLITSSYLGDGAIGGEVG